MGTRGTIESERRSDGGAPKLGLRFDRGRTELVLDAPIALPTGFRLDAMRTELAPLGGRLSLTEGWRAFRHRRSTLVAATVSIALRDLGALIGRALGLEVEIIALGEHALSVSTANDALSLAAELEWGWDAEDLLVVIRGARSLPLGPRTPLALAHDLAAQAGAPLDAARGVARLARPLRAVLLNALVPAGLRVPAVTGLALRASIEGDRLVVVADRTAGGVAEPSRAALEQARADAAAITACVEQGGEAPIETSPVAIAALALGAELAESTVDSERLATSARDYTQRERHASMASMASLRAAERATPTIASRLATSAIERGGLGRPLVLARAVELSAAASVGSTLPWEQLSRALEGGGPPVMRARALALEGAGRLAEALVLFADVTRADPRDDVAQRGIARALDAVGRHDEAISAWDRVAKLHDALDAKASAARAALAAGRVEAGIARLDAIVRGAEPSPIVLEAHVDLARALVAAGRDAEARLIDRALPRLADALGPIEASASAAALRDALDRALVASDVASARALVEALERTLGDAGATELAGHRAAVAGAETLALAAADPAALRARADALRASGQPVEAARMLVEIFAQTQDAAVLRAAIELADRASDASARLAVFDRALALLPPGAARDAIASRR